MHPEIELEASELRHMLLFYLNRRNAGLFVALYWGGYTYLEVAAEYGISVPRVRQCIASGIRRLREAYRSGRVPCEREHVALERKKKVRATRYQTRAHAESQRRALERARWRASRCFCGCEMRRPMCASKRCDCGCGAYWPYCGVKDIGGVREEVRAILHGGNDNGYSATDPS